MSPHELLKTSDSSALEKLADQKLVARCSTIKAALSIESSMVSWHKVVTLPKVMAQVVSRSTVRSLRMRTSKLSILRNTSCRVRTLVETPMVVSSLLHLKKLHGLMANMLFLVVLKREKMLLKCCKRFKKTTQINPNNLLKSRKVEP
jgi:hypothetical protein